ncbi:MAG: hypothetical protein HY897_26295 [Deltaproteobacteria bacterium]|nr:hypothetical protein [Deltaproteobacteria bacterium]
MSLGGAEKKAKAFELFAGLAILCFGVGTLVSWLVLRQFLDRPDLIPGAGSRMFWVTLIHDAGYIVCAPLFALAASKIVAGARLAPALTFVVGNYLIEEVLTTVVGGERVYWAWPWALVGRATAIAVALTLSFLAVRWNKPKGGGVQELRGGE